MPQASASVRRKVVTLGGMVMLSLEVPELRDEKAFGSVRVRMSEDLKAKLKAALKSDPSFAGNVSEFVNECARAYVLQRRKAQLPAYPVEFVLEKL